ncbi:MAG: YdcF family protein [Chloroflexota bacterium]|nr:MAG: YdcF family protein [Chloroflexota bacterium]
MSNWADRDFLFSRPGVAARGIVDRVVSLPISHIRPANAIAVHGGGDEAATRERVAWRLYEAGIANVIVALGGRLPPGDPDMTYANAVARRLLAIGTPRDAIAMSESGSSTSGELRALRDLARANGWRSVVLVTSPRHARRVDIVADRVLRSGGIDFTVAFEAAAAGTSGATTTRNDSESIGELAKLAIAIALETAD